MLLLISTFILGYLAIVFEKTIRLDKAASAIITGVLCWTIYISFHSSAESIHHATEELMDHLGEISGILFFLLGAMTIVELIDAHEGFQLISKLIHTTDKRKLLWIISLISFFLSAILDNLTTAIVMTSITQKILVGKKDRLFFIGLVVIACNAGGAWSPIGDITTTMLWIGKQVTATNIMATLFLPSLVSLLVPLITATFFVKGKTTSLINDQDKKNTIQQKIVFFTGVSILLLIPVFKMVTHLPPFMGMLLGLGIIWLVSELVSYNKDDENNTAYSVIHALKKIDTPSILFFLGILLSISALDAAGQLNLLSQYLNEKITNSTLTVTIIGLLSSVIDNVPLVAAAIGMYDLSIYPTDHHFWEFLAYCAGTGGSILIIGSAAGVAAMGMEKIDFIWYLKNISWLALLGYFSGIIVFLARL